MTDLDPTNKPMMNDREIALIDALLNAKQHIVALEWGSGNSTLRWGSCPAVDQWTTVEHDEEYCRAIEHRVSEKVTVLLRPTMDDYVRADPEGMYNFILVDGQDGSRESCLVQAFIYAQKDAIILLHDSGRTEYQDFIARYPHTKLCDGEIPFPNGCFAHRGLTMFYKL